MKVDNKNGIGNPYHDDNTGEFSSADSLSDNMSIESYENYLPFKRKISFIRQNIEYFEKELLNANEEDKEDLQDSLDFYKKMEKEEIDKINDTTILSANDFNRKYYGKIIGEKGNPKSIEEALSLTNPLYSRTNQERNENCKCCVYAYELLRRGYDVTAKPKTNNSKNTGFQNIFVGQYFTQKGELGKDLGSVKNNIIKRMKDWGEGARGIIYFHFATNNTAHVVNIENNQGNIQICEGQRGKIYSFEEYYSYLEKHLAFEDTLISRVDNLEYIYDEGIKYFVERRENNDAR